MIEVIKKIDWHGKTIEISTGRIANEADGSVIVKMGDSMVLCTCVSSKEIKEDLDFFALTVNYREMAFSAGKIPGGFIKREGKNSEKEILVSRLIDRPIRPLFASHFLNETQIICTVLSYDSENSTDIMAIIGAAAAANIAGVPIEENLAAARIGLINDKFVINPSFEMLKNSKLDLVIAATKDSVMMVEAEAELLSDEKLLEAIKFGHEAVQPVLRMLKELIDEVGRAKWKMSELSLEKLKEVVKKEYNLQLTEIIETPNKKDRQNLIDRLIEQAIQDFAAHTEYSKKQIIRSLLDSKAEMLRFNVLEHTARIDGRRFDEIRSISGLTSFLPRAHGSALFTRGETQALVVATLGTAQDEQLVESLDGEYRERFMLNYIFLPYCVGEVGPLRGAPGRREVGHGKLAWKAFNRIIPTKAQFPYSIRVVSEITSCNGSSSMATICGTSMALMDAGVGITTPIAGLAMGLIKGENNYVILSDIVSFEDALGDMDFKVAGSKDAITALQMDIKIKGISFDIIQNVLEQAQKGRAHILDEMEKIISHSKEGVSHLAPFMQTMKIDKDKIREVIGSGGKIIREICESTSCKIDISEDGTLSLSATNKEKVDAAIVKINSVILGPQIGDIFDGTVVKVLESIAFINYTGSKEGVLHISEVIDGKNLESLTTLLKQGEVIKVKVIGYDMKGKVKLTMKLDKPLTPKTPEKKDKEKHNIQNQPAPTAKQIVPSNSPFVKEESTIKPARKWKNPANSVSEEVKNERKYFS